MNVTIVLSFPSLAVTLMRYVPASPDCVCHVPSSVNGLVYVSVTLSLSASLVRGLRLTLSPSLMVRSLMASRMGALLTSCMVMVMVSRTLFVPSLAVISTWCVPASLFVVVLLSLVIHPEYVMVMLSPSGSFMSGLSVILSPSLTFISLVIFIWGGLFFDCMMIMSGWVMLFFPSFAVIRILYSPASPCFVCHSPFSFSGEVNV